MDDDLVILETLSNYLSSLECEVKALNNPQQFWEVLTNFQPNILVLDMKMPKFNGADLCQVVRTDPYWKNLSIVFVSTHTTKEEIDLAFAMGADDYISKSIDRAEMAARIIRRVRKGDLHKIAPLAISAT
ncbi:MAG: response regulator [Nostoc sp. ChiSLP02]|nr:response regulator [Nostoc sp. DedSLP05]MDZ8097972.1 response regulator [Nostoc sp. DedSLP01]MDZ8187945.1 response regulator [Nostoc sp. ChiSLP02]